MTDRSLLVLDLDETIIFSTHEPLAGLPSKPLVGYHVHPRPGLGAFLERASELYDVGVWTAAGSSYGEIITKTFVEPVVKPIFTFTSKRCTLRRDWDGDGCWISSKPLRKLRRFGYALERTLIIEDDPKKVSINYGNAIYVPPFEGQVNDVVLEHLADYLHRLHKQPNFRRIEKRGWLVDYGKSI